MFQDDTITINGVRQLLNPRSIPDVRNALRSRDSVAIANCLLDIAFFAQGAIIAKNQPTATEWSQNKAQGCKEKPMRNRLFDAFAKFAQHDAKMILLMPSCSCSKLYQGM